MLFAFLLGYPLAGNAPVRDVAGAGQQVPAEDWHGNVMRSGGAG
jgi:hypothetical protein